MPFYYLVISWTVTLSFSPFLIFSHVCLQAPLLPLNCHPSDPMPSDIRCSSNIIIISSSRLHRPRMPLASPSSPRRPPRPQAARTPPLSSCPLPAPAALCTIPPLTIPLRRRQEEEEEGGTLGGIPWVLLGAVALWAGLPLAPLPATCGVPDQCWTKVGARLHAWLAGLLSPCGLQCLQMLVSF